jgi:hypothetical protein
MLAHDLFEALMPCLSTLCTQKQQQSHTMAPFAQHVTGLQSKLITSKQEHVQLIAARKTTPCKCLNSKRHKVWRPRVQRTSDAASDMWRGGQARETEHAEGATKQAGACSGGRRYSHTCTAAPEPHCLALPAAWQHPEQAKPAAADTNTGASTHEHGMRTRLVFGGTT